MAENRSSDWISNDGIAEREEETWEKLSASESHLYKA